MRPRLLAAITLAATLSSACKGDARPSETSAESKPAPPPKPAPSLDGLPLDLHELDDDKKRDLGELLEKYPSPCGKPHSLLTSLRSDPSCKRSVFAARYIVRLLDAGVARADLEDAYEKRFTSPEMGSCDVANAPVRGNPSAPVTLCEFYDFQCPHCKLLEPILAHLVDEMPDQVRLYSKSFPLTRIHPDSRDAAAAAVAAGKQGKFWQMHDKLFQHQDHLTAADLEQYATELHLDVKKWKADLPAAYEQVDKDVAEGTRLGISGTPTLYINGRKYYGPMLYDEVKDWVDEELNK